ncbi:EIICB-Mtl, partial [Mesomycoplasma hyorhinis]
MLVNNFYLGILGFLLCFPAFFFSAYIIAYINVFLSLIVGKMQEHKLYPIVAIVVEPAKVLFLNNAINHGIFTPLGTQEVQNSGKSILFLLESNPGPGLGILLAW